MSMKLTKKDGILIALLSVLLIGVVYYLVFLSPLQKELTSVESQQRTVDDQVAVISANLGSMSKKQAELDAIFQKPINQITEIAPYDNAKAVMSFLNGILAQSSEYSLSCPDPTVGDDGTVRRVANLSFSAESYEIAKNILQSLANWNYRCILGSVTISAGNETGDIKTGSVSVSATMTFFESTKIQ